MSFLWFNYGSPGYKLERNKINCFMKWAGSKEEFQWKLEERLVGSFEANALFVKMKFEGSEYTLDISFTIKEIPDFVKIKTEELEKQVEKIFKFIQN